MIGRGRLDGPQLKRKLVSQTNPMLLITATVLGLVGALLGSFALARNVRQWRSLPHKRARAFILVAFALGTVLAASSFFVSYPYSATVRVVGFPFPAAVFEKHGEHWRDYVGPLTAPFSFANAWFAFVLPHLLVRTFRRKTGIIGL